MSTATPYRQQVSNFRARLERLLRVGSPEPGSRRLLIDTTGNRTKRVPYGSAEELLALYAEARHHSVARILALFQIMREVERPRKRIGEVRVTPTGAFWQAYKGTEAFNACHTCPSLLLLDGLLPSKFTINLTLQRHIVLEFGDCMLMPRSVNEADIFVDEAVGRAAFAMAAEEVLNRRDLGWQDGLEIFRSEMREVLGPVGQLMMSSYEPAPGDRALMDALNAYYEGMFLRKLNENEMRNFISQVLSGVNTQ
jgi:hypothetical protein